MCAIGGVVAFNAKINIKETVSNMLQSMKHRGPDSSGIWFEETVCLGHNRLAIIDLSSKANQPMTDNSGNFVLSFNGEIYNFKEIKTKLKEYHFKSDSDSEVLIASYIKWGEKCLNYLEGQFAFALWDKQNKSLFVARDPMGEKPFYYVYNHNGFYFSSEIRSLIKAFKLNKLPEDRYLSEFLAFQSVKAPNTLISDIKQLSPGQYAYIKNNNLRISNYWKLESIEERKYLELPEIKENISFLLKKSVSQQLISDVPLGAFLSGGLDSSIIVALASTLSNKKLRTFSVGFEESIYDERHYAEIIAKKFNTEHHEIIIGGNELVSRIPDILTKFDVPSGDGINSFIVSEAVKKQGITVALSGLGGDELFAGYPGFNQYYNLHGINYLFNNTLHFRKHLMTLFKGKLKYLMDFEKLNVYEYNSLSRMIFLPDEIDNLIEKKHQNEFCSFYSDKIPILSKYAIADLNNYTQPVLLKDTDQMAMSVSLEVRVPFFDKELIEFVLGIPDKYKYNKKPKTLLFETFQDLIPMNIFQRPKMGFTFPWDEWLRNELFEFCSYSLNNLNNRGIFKDNATIKIWKEFLAGKKGWNKIVLLFTLENWLNNLDEQ